MLHVYERCYSSIKTSAFSLPTTRLTESLKHMKGANHRSATKTVRISHCPTLQDLSQFANVHSPPRIQYRGRRCWSRCNLIAASIAWRKNSRFFYLQSNEGINSWPRRNIGGNKPITCWPVGWNMRRSVKYCLECGRTITRGGHTIYIIDGLAQTVQPTPLFCAKTILERSMSPFYHRIAFRVKSR